jgi:hypothetical protein
MHSRQHDDEVQFYAFDALALDGDDLRKQNRCRQRQRQGGKRQLGIAGRS